MAFLLKGITFLRLMLILGFESEVLPSVSVMRRFSVGELLSGELWFVNNVIHFGEIMAKINNFYN